MKYFTILLLVIWAFVLCEGGLFSSGGPSISPDRQQYQKKDYHFRVDPQNIIRLICKHAGMVLPEYITRDLEVIASVCQCDETSLDLINKELKVRNLRVVMPLTKKDGKNNHDRTALNVGAIRLTWDSYLHPCIEVEVEDVDILVEFINLILTKNNWNELEDIGFPPQFYDLDDPQHAESPTFVRIGSIQMLGEIRLKIRSRPLDKQLVEDIVFDMGRLKELSNLINSASQRAEKETGRRGLETQELYDIINAYFNRQIKQFVKVAAADVVIGAINPDEGGKTVNDVKKLFSGAVNAAMKYSKDVGSKADETIESNLKNLGIGPKEFNMAKDLFKSSADSLLGDRNEKRTNTNDDELFSNVYVIESDDESY